MGSYTAIADVSETLVTLLRDRIEERSDVLNVARDQVVVASPEEAAASGDVRLSLYLYRVSGNGPMNNAVKQQVGDNTRADPPLTLDLHYLLTAYPTEGSDDLTANTTDQQRILGLAMQVLNDHGPVSSEHTTGSLQDDLQLGVSLDREPLDELTTLWNSVTDAPYRPSAAYLVSPVRIESRQEEAFERVAETETSVAEKTDTPGALEAENEERESGF